MLLHKYFDRVYKRIMKWTVVTGICIINEHLVKLLLYKCLYGNTFLNLLVLYIVLKSSIACTYGIYFSTINMRVN